MRLKKIPSLKDMLIIGTFGWGLSLATIATWASLMGFSSKVLEAPREIVFLYLVSMVGGFCWGGLGWFLGSIYIKKMKRIMGGWFVEE